MEIIMTKKLPKLMKLIILFGIVAIIFLISASTGFYFALKSNFETE